jgi:hypothetical protein
MESPGNEAGQSQGANQMSESPLMHRPFAEAWQRDERPTFERPVQAAQNFAAGWRKLRAITLHRLPSLGDVVIRERRGSLYLIRVLSVTAALDSNYSGFVGVYCDRSGQPVTVRSPRFYRSGKISEGGFFRARPNHKRPVFELPAK